MLSPNSPEAGGKDQAENIKAERASLPKNVENPFAGLFQDQLDRELVENARQGNLANIKLIHAAGGDLAANLSRIKAAGLAHSRATEGISDALINRSVNRILAVGSRDNLPAEEAAGGGHLPVLEYLKGKAGVDFSARDNAPLRAAAENYRINSLVYLRDNIPDIDLASVPLDPESKNKGGIDIAAILKKGFDSEKVTEIDCRYMDLQDLKDLIPEDYMETKYIKKLNIADSRGPKTLLDQLTKLGAKNISETQASDPLRSLHKERD